HTRMWGETHPPHQRAEPREEALQVGGAAAEHAEEIDAGREDAAGAGDDDGGSLLGAGDELRLERGPQLRVERARLAVLQPQHDHRSLLRALDHPRPPPTRDRSWRAASPAGRPSRAA